MTFQNPPEGLPRYRLLTGTDDAGFCSRVSAALDAGYELRGSPAIAVAGDRTRVAQVVIWPGTGVEKIGELS